MLKRVDLDPVVRIRTGSYRAAPAFAAALLLTGAVQAQPEAAPGQADPAAPPPVAEPPAAAPPAAAPVAEAPSGEVAAPVEPAPPPAPVEPVPAPPPDQVPEGATYVDPATTSEHQEAPPELPAAETPPEEPFVPKLSFGAGFRTGLNLTVNNPEDEVVLKLDDGLVDQMNVRPFLSGELTPNLGFFVQFEIGTANGLGHFAILDGIAQVKFIDELQLWVGQHIPANDRNNMNGPFFGNTWNFAITVPSFPFDVGGRDRGATLWGLIAGGHLKYHASVVDLQPNQPIGKARYAGRITAHLLEPEDFYYNSGSYWGEKDVLALGAVVQYQDGITPEDPAADPDTDFFGWSLDAFFEKNFGAAGTFTAELGYWNFDEVGTGYVVNQGTVDEGIGVVGPFPGQAYMGVLSWLTPDRVGIGYLQPNARVQYGDYDASSMTTVDVGLAYVVDGFNHKYHLNYRHHEVDPEGLPSVSEDMVQIGFQYIMSN